MIQRFQASELLSVDGAIFSIINIIKRNYSAMNNPENSTDF